MYICLCNAVTDKKLKKMIKEGLTSLEEVAQKCGAGKNCGACRCAISDLIQSEVGEKKEDDTKDKEKYLAVS